MLTFSVAERPWIREVSTLTANVIVGKVASMHRPYIVVVAEADIGANDSYVAALHCRAEQSGLPGHNAAGPKGSF